MNRYTVLGVVVLISLATFLGGVVMLIWQGDLLLGGKIALTSLLVVAAALSTAVFLANNK